MNELYTCLKEDRTGQKNHLVKTKLIYPVNDTKACNWSKVNLDARR